MTNAWVRREGNQRVVGISRYAVEEIGEIVHIELPEIGRSVQEGEVVCILESTKSATEFSTPISGTIVDINRRLLQEPTLINQYPETEGWLFRYTVQK